MDKNLLDQWLKALRSGEYKQTTQRLKDNVGYCCLGVLCEFIPGVKFVEYDIEYKGALYGPNMNYHRFREIFYEIFDDNEMDSNYFISTLMRMNDHENKTFSEIADFIEEYYKVQDIGI